MDRKWPKNFPTSSTLAASSRPLEACTSTPGSRSDPGESQSSFRLINSRVVVVALMVERSLLTLEDRGSYPAINQFLCIIWHDCRFYTIRRNMKMLGTANLKN